MLIINTNYKNIKNQYEIHNDIANITVLKKDGAQLIVKIDADDLERVLKLGSWFAEWHKDFNNYIIQNISEVEVSGKSKFVKQNLQAVILNANSKAPIKHINGDTLDNRKENLEIVQRNNKNEYKIIDNNEVAIILKDKYGKSEAKALVSKEDLHSVITDEFSWVYYKSNGEVQVIANTPNGRVRLDEFIMKPDETMHVHHINLNPLDNRRSNLENKLKQS